MNKKMMIVSKKMETEKRSMKLNKYKKNEEQCAVCTQLTGTQRPYENYVNESDLWHDEHDQHEREDGALVGFLFHFEIFSRDKEL